MTLNAEAVLDIKAVISVGDVICSPHILDACLDVRRGNAHDTELQLLSENWCITRGITTLLRLKDAVDMS